MEYLPDSPQHCPAEETQSPPPELPQSQLLAYIGWLLTHDVPFLEAFADRIRARFLQTPELACFFDRALTYFRKYNKPMPYEALELAFERPVAPELRNVDPAVVLSFYRDAPEPSEALIPYLYERTAEWITAKEVREVMLEALDLLGEGRSTDAAEVLAEAGSRVSAGRVQELGLWMFRDVDRFVQELAAELHPDTSRAVPTGLPMVDFTLQGGLRPGELAVIAGPPARGKSQMLVYLARQALWRGLTVVYYTLEMSATRILERVWSGALDVSVQSLCAEGGEVAATISAWTQRHDPLGDLLVTGYQASTATVADVATHLRYVTAELGRTPDVVLVDYADILAPARRHQERRDELARIYEDLRSLSQRLEVPIWTASQTNRTSLKKSSIGMEDLSDCWDKAKIADYIIGLCQSDEDKAAGYMELAFAKVRNNEAPPPILCQVDFSKSLFQETGEWRLAA